MKDIPEGTPTHELRILISCPTDSEVLSWVNTLTELRHQVGCVSVSMEPVPNNTGIES